jgi:EF hand
MSKLTVLTLASVLTLGAGAGLVHAQTAGDPPPQAQAGTPDCEPGDTSDACADVRPDRRDGWNRHRDKHGMHADKGGDRRDGHGRHGDDRHGGGRMMRIIDANGDGVINDDEAASLADFAFMRLDRDGDGTVSEAEFTEMRGFGRRDGFAWGWFNWGGKEEADAVLKVRKDKFASLDADKNGSVSKTEFFAEAKTKLAAADTDKDGKVTPWEFRANFSPMR